MLRNQQLRLGVCQWRPTHKVRIRVKSLIFSFDRRRLEKSLRGKKTRSRSIRRGQLREKAERENTKDDFDYLNRRLTNLVDWSGDLVDHRNVEPAGTRGNDFLQDETIKDIQTSANEIYNAESDDSDQQNIEGAVEYYEEQKNEAATIDDRNRITIAEMLFYAANSYPERVVEVGDGINPDDLPLDEALTYCNAMVNAWNSLGEPENAEQCEEFIENNTMIDTNGVG